MAATAVFRNVFVYGTLLAPEVLNALLHRVPRAALAVVQDYHRYSITHRIYPAVLPKKSDKVFGKVLFDLSDQEQDLLDEFEDIEYTKFTVSPLILKAHDVDGESVNEGAQELTGPGCLERVSNTLNLPNGHTENGALEEKTVEISPGHHVGLKEATEVTADIYIWANEQDPALRGVWDYEEWRKIHLDDYVKMCEEFRSEYDKTGNTSRVGVEDRDA